MSILQQQLVTTGMADSPTSIIFLSTNDTLATVTTAGYLSKYLEGQTYQLSVNQLAAVYTTDSGTIMLQVVVSAGIWSLANNAVADVVATPTVDNQICYATNTGGSLAASGLSTSLFNAGNISAGISGTAGSLISYSATATKGYLALTAVANTAAYDVTISNVAYGQTSILSFADVGSAVGRFLVANTATPFTSGNLIEASGVAGLTIDSGVTVASVSGAITQLGQLYQTSVTLTAAEVIAAYATPQVLIPAVAGKVAIVHSANVYTNVSTAFTTGVAPIIQYGTTVHGAGTIATGTGLVTGDITAAASQVRTIGQAASTTYTGITNTAVCFSCTTAYAVGTGSTVTFSLVYELITATV